MQRQEFIIKNLRIEKDTIIENATVRNHRIMKNYLIILFGRYADIRSFLCIG